MSIDALSFVRQHGVVLESGKGPVPNLAEAVAGTPIRGSWWSHPDGKKIFRATRLVRSNEHVLVCRLVDGKLRMSTVVCGRLSYGWLNIFRRKAWLRFAKSIPPQASIESRRCHFPNGRR
jgi:hypothetical protein